LDRISEIINKNSDQADYDYKLKIFLVASIILFIGLALLFFILLILSRTKHQRNDTARSSVLLLVEDIFNKILFEDKSLEEIGKQIDITKHLKDKFFRSVLLNELLRLHGNFTGVYADKLVLFYREAELIKDSNKKLNSYKWHIKCKGAKELAQMGVSESFNDLRKLYINSNRVFKEELGYAIVRLDGFNGLIFLLDNSIKTDEWQQLNIISILNKSDKSKLPDFSFYLNSTNTHLTVFSIRLISYFKQASSLPVLSELLNHKSVKVRKLVIQAMVTFYAEEYVTTLLNNYADEAYEIKIEIIKALSVLGNETHKKFLLGQLKHPEFDVCYLSIISLQSIMGTKIKNLIKEEIMLSQHAISIINNNVY
jgi:hypothetical protein